MIESEGADVGVFIVQEFASAACDSKKLEANAADLAQFVQRISRNGSVFSEGSLMPVDVAGTLIPVGPKLFVGKVRTPLG